MGGAQGMDINVGMIAAGLAVGILVGLTGMGAGSLVPPILISVVGILVLVAIVVAARTFVTIPGIWDADRLPTDGQLTAYHKTLAVVIGVIFGFILGLTSVGSGVFFGIALVTLFPLSARRVVGTDL